MPLYIFRNPKTGEVKEIFQKMTQKHSYKSKGVIWERLFTNPQASFSTKIDPFSQKDFNRITAEKRGNTIGQMQDFSQELSEQRAKIAGSDPIKDKTIDDYERKTHKKHPSKIPKVAEVDLCKGTIDKLTF